MAIFNDNISINSILGTGSSVKGDVKINGFARIDGDIDGNIEATGNVIIGENARIRGNIKAKSITVIGGIVLGDIVAPDFIKLLSSSVVIGDLQTKNLFQKKMLFCTATAFHFQTARNLHPQFHGRKT